MSFRVEDTLLEAAAALSSCAPLASALEVAGGNIVEDSAGGFDAVAVVVVSFPLPFEIG